MYTIYRIPGRKVGCTIDFEARKKQYPEGTKFEILETWDESVGDQFAGDREFYWADVFGYPRWHHYSKNWNSTMTFEQRSAAGKSAAASPYHNSRTGDLQRASAASPNHISRTGVLQGASVASENHVSKTQKSGFHVMSLEKRKEIAKKSLAGPSHVSKTGKSGFHTGAAGRSGAKIAAAGPNSVNKQYLKCLDHDKIGTVPGMKRWHPDCTLVELEREPQ